MTRLIEAEELDAFRTGVRRFVEREVAPHAEEWRDGQRVPREAWLRAGEAGLLGVSIPEEHGGAGGNFRHEAVIIEELARIGFLDFGIPLHNGIVAPYVTHYGTPEQKRVWLPRLATGEMIGAIAMTEPNTGSDLQAIRSRAVRDGNGYRLSGQKTFITNGQNANLILVAAKTDSSAGSKGLSLLAVETDNARGFRRGRNLKKVGFHAQDTSELFFDDVPLDGGRLLGGVENQGFYQLMGQLPQERLIIALQGVASIEAALPLTIDYAKQRTAFGKTLLEFQNSRFVLAECATEARIARIFVNDCIERLVAGTLDATTAAMAKYWATDRQGEIMDRCLQIFGGYGYMAEYPISNMWVDARLQKIYGGTNEIMKELIARSL